LIAYLGDLTTFVDGAIKLFNGDFQISVEFNLNVS